MYAHHINICCIFNDRGAWCSNEKVKRSLFGYGARCCREYPKLHGSRCKFKIKPKRPTPPTTPPKGR